MKSQNTIEFKDLETNDEGVAVFTKHENGSISISLSLKQKGDIAVVLPKEKASEFQNGLRELVRESECICKKCKFTKRGCLIATLIIVVPFFLILAVHILLIIGFSAYHLLNG